MAVTTTQITKWRADANRLQPHLVTTGEIADLTGETLQTVNSWAMGRRRKDFPKPVLEVGRPLGPGGRQRLQLWLWPEVRLWYAKVQV